MKVKLPLKIILTALAIFFTFFINASGQSNIKVLPKVDASLEEAEILLNGPSFDEDKAEDIPEWNFLVALMDYHLGSHPVITGSNYKSFDPLNEIAGIYSGPNISNDLSELKRPLYTQPKTQGSFDISINLEFAGKGGKDAFTDMTGNISVTTTRITYLEIPILACYTLNLKRNTSIYGALGPYFGYALGGHFKDEQGTQKVTFGKNGDFTRGDAGIQLHVGYNLGTIPIFFGIFTEYGLHNLIAGPGAQDDKNFNRSYGLEVGYRLKK
jgi:Outer membrane protein beta-barrel domain